MLALGLVVGLIQSGAQPPCPLDVVAERVHALAPSVGPVRPSVDDGVVALEFSRPDEGVVALLAVRAAGEQIETVATAPRATDLRDGLSALGPKLVADDAFVDAVMKCPVGDTTAQEHVRAWEASLRAELSETEEVADVDVEPEPTEAVQHDQAESEGEHAAPEGEHDAAQPHDDDEPPDRVTRSGPELTVAIGAAAVLVALLGLFARRRETLD